MSAPKPEDLYARMLRRNLYVITPATSVANFCTAVLTAFAAALVARRSRVLGVHLNDGYGKRDDGLMVGAVHGVQTLELLRRILQDGYGGVIYFDTFPDASGLDPVAECAANITEVEAMLDTIDRLNAHNGLAEAIAAQDGIASLGIVRSCMSRH